MGSKTSKIIKVAMKLRNGKEYVYPEPQIIENERSSGSAAVVSISVPLVQERNAVMMYERGSPASISIQERNVMPISNQEPNVLSTINRRNIGFNATSMMWNGFDNANGRNAASMMWNRFDNANDRTPFLQQTSTRSSAWIWTIIRFISLMLGVIGGLRALINFFVEPDVIVHEVHLMPARSWTWKWSD